MTLLIIMPGKQESNKFIPVNQNMWSLQLQFTAHSYLSPKYTFQFLQLPWEVGPGEALCERRQNSCAPFGVRSFEILSNAVHHKKRKLKLKTSRKYVFSLFKQNKELGIPEDAKLLRLFSLRNYFGYLSRDIIKKIILDILINLWLCLIWGSLSIPVE